MCKLAQPVCQSTARHPSSRSTHKDLLTERLTPGEAPATKVQREGMRTRKETGRMFAEMTVTWTCPLESSPLRERQRRTSMRGRGGGVICALLLASPRIPSQSPVPATIARPAPIRGLSAVFSLAWGPGTLRVHREQGHDTLSSHHWDYGEPRLAFSVRRLGSSQGTLHGPR